MLLLCYVARLNVTQQQQQ